MPKINIFGHFSSKRQSQNFSDKILLDNEEILSFIAEIFSRSVYCYENISFKGFKFFIFGLPIFFISVCSFANLENYKLHSFKQCIALHTSIQKKWYTDVNYYILFIGKESCFSFIFTFLNLICEIF